MMTIYEKYQTSLPIALWVSGMLALAGLLALGVPFYGSAANARHTTVEVSPPAPAQTFAGPGGARCTGVIFREEDPACFGSRAVPHPETRALPRVAAPAGDETEGKAAGS